MARKSPQVNISLADSLCDPNARWVTAFDCVNGVTGNWGCMTIDNFHVPQVNQFVIGPSGVGGSSPTIINGVSYPWQPNFWLIINVQPQNPNILGNTDMQTANLIGSTACGYECNNAGCYWTGLPSATHTTYNDCTTAVNAGLCYTTPRYYCTDFHCAELYNQQMGWGQSSSPTAAQVTAMILPGPYVKPGPIPYRDVYTTIDDCLACCGGINTPTYSSGAANPYYGMTTNPTPHAGWAAYLTTTGQSQNSASFINYMWTQGIDSCGDIWCTPWPGC